MSTLDTGERVHGNAVFGLLEYQTVGDSRLGPIGVGADDPVFVGFNDGRKGMLVFGSCGERVAVGMFAGAANGIELGDGVCVTAISGGTTGPNAGARVDGTVVNFGFFVGAWCFFGCNGGSGCGGAYEGSPMVGI